LEKVDGKKNTTPLQTIRRTAPYETTLTLFQDSAIDTSNFDQEFTSEAPTDSVVDDSQLSETVQLQFQGWSYKGGSANGVRASINDGPSSIIG
jgi:hypothetical protein